MAARSLAVARALAGLLLMLAAAFHWTLATVPGVGHSDAGMAKAAVRLIAAEAGASACPSPRAD